MYVSTQHKCLLIEQSKIPALRGMIPHAQEWSNGQSFWVVPHRIDESIVLRNCGIDVPSPVESEYDWPGQYAPFQHQIATTAFLTLNRRAFVLSDIGTGKTLSAYWAADYLMRARKLRRVLVVSPLSTLERVHGDALFSHFTHRTFAVLYGASAKRRQLFNIPHDFYIVNYEGIPALTDGRKEPSFLRDDIDLVLIDECAAYRNSQTERWRWLKKLLKPHMWVWGMTGTPTPNEPTDAYGQVRLINPAACVNYPSFRAFQLATMDQLHMYKWRAKSSAIHTVYRTMQPSIRFTRDECLDLPDCLYETRTVEMSDEQAKVYRELLRNSLAEVQGGRVTALNEGVLLMRLVQAASGVVYDQTGKHIELDCASRLAALEEIIEEAGGKVIVFVPFRGNLDFLESALTTKDRSVVRVDGDTSSAIRNRIFSEFQSSGNPRVLIAHPGCMSHGLTLTQASTIVWWSAVNSNETYEQANGRINRPGQKRNMLVVHLAGSEVERRVYRKLEQKQKLQGILLDMVAAQA